MSNKLVLIAANEVAARIVSLAKTAGEVQSEIHLLACSTLEHIRATGDMRGALQLLNALPNGQRVKALAQWFRVFSTGKFNPKMDKETKTWEGSLAKGRSDEDFQVDAACETTFADLTAERDPVSVTVESMVRNLERNAKNTEQHDNGTPKVDPAARALAAKLVAFVRDNKLLAA